jgi:hypothetical protein
MPQQRDLWRWCWTNNTSKALTQTTKFRASPTPSSVNAPGSLVFGLSKVLLGTHVLCVAVSSVSSRILPFDLSVAYLALAFYHMSLGDGLVAAATQAGGTISSHS